MAKPAAKSLSLRDLADSLAEKLDISKAGAYDALAETFAGIGKTVHGGGKVSVYQFGTFSLRERKARTGRNPQTGETIKIAPSKSLVFKASSAQKASKKK